MGGGINPLRMSLRSFASPFCSASLRKKGRLAFELAAFYEVVEEVGVGF